ncbi:MAG TPA: NAD(P)/FAD-dependent oxidoreductase [Vicinamibacterales bacterium]|jgi:L-2-hydroxyglutarate oxidase LhgO
MTDIDCVVIGGGVVGLACAAEIAAKNRSVCLLERHPRLGIETSTHNSGVLHAGIYYPTGTLKAELSIRGRRQLYEFCATHGVPHVRCGKLIVPSGRSDEAAALEELEALWRLGTANGVEELALVDEDFVRAREPFAKPTRALWSGSTGIVETETLVRTLKHLCESRGVMIVVGSPVIGGDGAGDMLVVRTPGESIRAATVVNCAGLYADDVSAMFGGQTFTIYPCRGEYVELTPSKRYMVNGLIYPLPHLTGHGLGVHATKTTWGSVLLGPTARYQTRKDDYEENRLTVEDFVQPVRQLLPGLEAKDLRLAGSGIRPKLHPATESFRDFLIGRDANVPALVQVSGIDSPGLTSCLAIGEHVGAIVNHD